MFCISLLCLILSFKKITCVVAFFKVKYCRDIQRTETRFKKGLIFKNNMKVEHEMFFKWNFRDSY